MTFAPWAVGFVGLSGVFEARSGRRGRSGRHGGAAFPGSGLEPRASTRSPCFFEDPRFCWTVGCSLSGALQAACLGISLGGPLSRSSGKTGLPTTQWQKRGRSESGDSRLLPEPMEPSPTCRLKLKEDPFFSTCSDKIFKHREESKGRSG